MNYILDGEIVNFKELLNNSLNITTQENELCLISKNPLEKYHITLPCKHKFNHIDIFNEVKQQKLSKNYNDFTNLKKHQIKCPYCRKVHNTLLPYYDSNVPGITKHFGVNAPSDLCMPVNTCAYTFKSGKKKGIRCDKHCMYEFCKQHSNIKISPSKKPTTKKLTTKKPTPKKNNYLLSTSPNDIKLTESLKLCYTITNNETTIHKCCCSKNDGTPCSIKPSKYNTTTLKDIIIKNALGDYHIFDNDWYNIDTICKLIELTPQIKLIKPDKLWVCHHHYKHFDNILKEIKDISNLTQFKDITPDNLAKINDLIRKIILLIQGK